MLAAALQISLAVLAPGDALPLHDRERELAEQAAAARRALPPSGGGAAAAAADTGAAAVAAAVAAMVLPLPRLALELRFIVVTIHRVEGLPVMDRGLFASALGGLGLAKGNGGGSIDAYVRVACAGVPPVRTKTRTARVGAARRPPPPRSPRSPPPSLGSSSAPQPTPAGPREPRLAIEYCRERCSVRRLRF